MSNKIKVNKEIHQIFRDLRYKNNLSLENVLCDFDHIPNLSMQTNEAAFTAYVIKDWSRYTWDCSEERIQSQVLTLESHIKKYFIDYFNIRKKKEQDKKDYEVSLLKEEEERNKRIENLDITLEAFSKKHKKGK